MIRAIIVDDEPKALKKLEKHLAESGLVEIRGRFTNPLPVLEAVRQTKIDAVFVDIEMPETDGLTLAGQILDIDPHIAVVFVTAYNEYAVQAFEINAVDYLLKPINKQRVSKTIDRIIREKNIPVGKSQLQVYCFGKFRVVPANSGKEFRWRTHKAEELFAFFVDSRGRQVGNDELTEKVFGEFDAVKAYNNLKVSIYYIKKALAAEGAEGLLKNVRGAYQFEAESIWCDYYMFDRFASGSVGVSESNIRQVEDVLNLYQGGYLEKNYYSWAENTMELIRETYLGMLREASRYYRGKNEIHTAVGFLKQGLKIDPLHHALNKAVLEAYIGANDRLSALRHYDTYQKKLKQECGWELDDEIRDILKEKL